ncbi:MAG TPA: MarR family transcriptional regulator [Candidatus Angelobacter sp.]|nr:MarR family transcriptional regulator [Candidatus Angelobacter sp.]
MARQLKPTELRAWRAFLDAQATVLRRLEADLVAADGMTLAEFDVLIQLRLAPDRRLRMTDLSERVRLSPSGITRLVDRLTKTGLVKRGRCASDRRGTWAILTAAGRERIDRVTPIHLRGVRDYFAQRMSPAQMINLAAALEGVAREPATSVSSAS